jgi:hypothetical protein
MNNLVQFPRKQSPRDPIKDWRAEDTRRRIEATKDCAREAWFVIFWPFGVVGLLFGWKGFLIGSAVGLAFYLIILNEMRYGKEL